MNDERGENRGAAEEREDGCGGRLEEGLDGQRERGQREERDVVTVVGAQGASSQHSQLEQTNGHETDSVVSNGREARCALAVSLHLSFSKCCFVCSPLNKATVPQKGTTLYLLLYIITSHSRQACLLLKLML